MMEYTEHIEGQELLELVPQRPPMLMVDQFLGISDGVSWSGLTVRPDNVFCTGGVFAAPGIVEHMAQSAAARAGYSFRKDGCPVPLGFVASIEKMHFSGSLPRPGDSLRTSVEVVADIFGMCLVHAVCWRGEEVLAEGDMKIYLDTERDEKA